MLHAIRPDPYGSTQRQEALQPGIGEMASEGLFMLVAYGDREPSEDRTGRLDAEVVCSCNFCNLVVHPRRVKT